MREILFRGKRIDNGEWACGFYNEFANNYTGEQEHFIQTVKQDGRIGYIRKVYPETVGQYTGLTDKNGTRIFEGDILRRAYHPSDDLIVEWHDGSFSFRKRTLPKEYGYEALCCTQQTVSWLRVVGNIHDNPELIGERKDNE